MLCVSSWKNKQILINYNKQKFSLSRCLGWSPESCPCAVTSRVFVRGEPVTEKKEKRKESRVGTHRLLKEQSRSLCTIFGARTQCIWLLPWLDCERGACAFVVLFLVCFHQESSTEVCTPPTTGMSQKERPTFYRQELNKTIWEVPERYQNLSPVGSGAYGTVW